MTDHKLCHDCDARILEHRNENDPGHCHCGESWPCPEAVRELQQVKATFAEGCNRMLEGRAHTFVIGPQSFAPAVWREPENGPHDRPTDDHKAIVKVNLDDPVSRSGRVVSAAAIRMILDWALNDFAMDLPDFLAGMFLGEPWDKKTPPWRLIPEPGQRITAESLGFDHLYPRKSP